LTTLIVESPKLELDPCATALNGLLLHTWKPEGGLKDTHTRMDTADLTTCDGSPLDVLRDAFYETEPKKFESVHTDSEGWSDLRGGMATLASVIYGVASELASAPPDAWQEVSNACTLDGVRVVYDCSGEDL
jgi:hypothetical protein